MRVIALVLVALALGAACDPGLESGQNPLPPDIEDLVCTRMGPSVVCVPRDPTVVAQ